MSITVTGLICSETDRELLAQIRLEKELLRQKVGCRKDPERKP